MFGLIMMHAVVVVSTVAYGAGVDSREPSTNDRRPAWPVGLRQLAHSDDLHPFRLAARRPRAWDGSQETG
jgi:hypothetical protein